jgi:hypothetical protein
LTENKTEKMGEHIKVYCRLRAFTPEDESMPESNQSAFLTPQDDNEAGCFTVFNTDRGECIYQRAADNSDKDGKQFKFDGLLGKESTQEMVYEAVGSNIVKGCLDGFNGSVLISLYDIFSYGFDTVQISLPLNSSYVIYFYSCLHSFFNIL